MPIIKRSGTGLFPGRASFRNRSDNFRSRTNGVDGRCLAADGSPKFVVRTRYASLAGFRELPFRRRRVHLWRGAPLRPRNPSAFLHLGCTGAFFFLGPPAPSQVPDGYCMICRASEDFPGRHSIRPHPGGPLPEIALNRKARIGAGRRGRTAERGNGAPDR